MNIIGALIEMVLRIWSTDSELRDRSVLGQSEFDRQSRRFVGWLCGSVIAILLLAGILCWWITRG